MLKTVYAIAVAAIVAACFVVFVSLTPQVVEASSPVPGTKGDRADVRPLGTECGQKEWPYFDAACLRDTRNVLVAPREVRIISANRLPGPIKEAAR